MNELHLFAGAGGGILAGQLLGHTTVCAVEWEPYAQAVLVARQNDGTFPPFPIWDDVQTFDGNPWCGIVDIVAGGFPCQDISVAGKGAGIDGERSGMWHHMARIIGEVRPNYVLVENSPALLTRGLGVVLSGLAALGYDCKWGVLGAADVGAPHKRERIWIVAHAIGQQPYGGGTWAEQDHSAESENRGCAGCCYVFDHDRLGRYGCPNCEGEDIPDAGVDDAQGLEPETQPGGHRRQAGLHDRARSLPAWPADPADAPESGLVRVAHGVAHRSHRIKAIGNGQVSRVAAAAWRMLTEKL